MNDNSENKICTAKLQVIEKGDSIDVFYNRRSISIQDAVLYVLRLTELNDILKTSQKDLIISNDSFVLNAGMSHDEYFSLGLAKLMEVENYTNLFDKDLSESLKSVACNGIRLAARSTIYGYVNPNIPDGLSDSEIMPILCNSDLFMLAFSISLLTIIRYAVVNGISSSAIDIDDVEYNELDDLSKVYTKLRIFVSQCYAINVN